MDKIPESLTTYGVRNHFLKSTHQWPLCVGDVVNAPILRYEDDCDYGDDCDDDIFKRFDGEYFSTSGEFKEYYVDDDDIDNFAPGNILLKDGDKPLPPNVDELIKLCDPSKYGDLRTQTTVLNEEVRKAYEIPGNKLNLTALEENDVLEDIADTISENMYGGRSVNLALNKLNVYTKGGHFSTHVDTPKENMIGTLIVELPYDYEGGEFILKGKPHNLKNKWIAFYSSLPHSIQKVESGCRVSLTFYIMIGDNYYSKESYMSSVGSVSHTGDEILKKLEKEDVGLVLSHKYSCTEWEHDVYKGSDAYLMKYLSDKCIVASVFPAVLNHYESWDDYCGGTTADESVYRFTEDDIITVAGIMNKEKTKADFAPLEHTNISFIYLGHEQNCERGFEEEEQYIEHTGNECQEGYGSGQYFTMVAVLSKDVTLSDELCAFLKKEKDTVMPRYKVEQEIRKYIKEKVPVKKDKWGTPMKCIDEPLQKLLGLDRTDNIWINEIRPCLKKHYND